MKNGAFFRKEEENRVQTEGRLPPGQSLTNRLPVLHYGPVPKVDLGDWDFRIFGAVAEEKRWTWETFRQLPRVKIIMDIHCVTRWSKFDTEWEGVSLGWMVREGLVEPDPDAAFILQHCEQGYTTNLPLEAALAENFLLATHYNGEPLPLEHGYPLRAVVGALPDRNDLKDVYFWKGGKWLRGIEFRTADRMGFWEEAGYHNEADIWKEQRVG
ncbi:MAG: sulfite oxidase-like oxidoreductase [Anaerolineales bacterium]|nr:sulfite oxidase-like oxidoreductase [Anaerolineales bacterium]